MSVRSEVKKILSGILHVSEDVLENTPLFKIDNWDSTLHMYIICAIEEKFSITFNSNEYFVLDSINMISECILSKLNKKNTPVITKKKSIVLWGTCMTQEALMQMSAKDEISYIKLFSRTSLASQATPPFALYSMLDINKIKVDYERIHIVEDMEKKIFDELFNYDFDYLILDLIDTKAKLFFSQETACTYFFEETLLAAGFNRCLQYGHFINPNSDFYFELWKRGWEQFWNLITSRGLEKKIILNELFLAEKCDDGSHLDRNNPEKIIEINENYNKLYQFIRRYVDKDAILSYDRETFVAASTHKWGKSPSHYNKCFLEEMKWKIQQKII